jgi:uncharacterized membrane protein
VFIIVPTIITSLLLVLFETRHLRYKVISVFRGAYGYGNRGGSGVPSFIFGLLAVIFFIILLVIVIISNPFIQFLGVETAKGNPINATETLRRIVKVEAGRVLLANVLTTVFTFLWSLLFIIPGIMKQASYAMTNYLLARHPELTANEAITLSRQMMRGYKIEYIIFQYSFYIWLCLSMLCGGLVGFYVFPYQGVSNTLFFEKIYDAKVIKE